MVDEGCKYDGEMLYGIARGYALLGNQAKVVKLLKEALLKNPGPTIEEISIDPHFVGIEFDFDNKQIR